MPRSVESALWPLVGRDSELQRVAALRSAAAPGGVLIAPAGYGKSRLAREAVSAAGSDGAFTAWVQGTQTAASVPLAAFATLLPEAGSDQLLTLIRQSIAALRSRAGTRPLVLGIDDAHLLDPISAALVLHLAMTRSAFLVVTLRTGEGAPDAVGSLTKDAGLARIDLPPLDEAATGRLVETALGGAVEQRAVRWVHERSEGNPLYVRELLIGAVDSGSLEPSRGLWRLVGRPPMTGSLRGFMEQRLAALGDDVRQAVELLAIGEPLPLSAATELTSHEALSAAEEQHMLTIDAGGPEPAVRLAHPLVGDVIHGSLSPGQADDLRRRLAAAVGHGKQAGPGDALRVARWWLDAGDPIPAELLLDAARAALVASDPELASQLARLAIGGGQRAEGSLLLARACIARKRFEEAATVLADAQDAIADPSIALDYLELYISVLFWGLHREDDLRALFERAQAWWPEPSWQQRLHPLRLYVEELGRPYGSTLSLSKQILDDASLVPDVRLQVERIHAIDLLYAGRAKESVAWTTRMRPSPPLEDPQDQFAASSWVLAALESGDDWPVFARELEAYFRTAIRLDDRPACGLAAYGLGALGAAGGRLDDAARWFAESELQLEHGDVYGSLSLTRACIAELHAVRGQLEPLGPSLERAWELLDGTEPRPGQIPTFTRAQAWARHARGDADGARALLLATAREILPMPLFAAQLGYEAMRAGADPEVVRPVIEDAAARCDGRLTGACARDVAARASGDADAIIAVSEHLEGLGATVYAMEAAAAAAWTVAGGRRRETTRRAAMRAERLHALGQGLRRPELPAVGSAVPLTDREHELIRMAGAGLSNADIADRLSLSIRTVETHLYRAMQKLGVSDRREL